MARLIDGIVGHRALAQQIALSHHEGEPVTWLFAGPAGIGKKKTARAIAQMWMCERDKQACGECGSCRRMEKLEHESYLEIKPDGAQIKVDQAREIIEFTRLNSISRHRVIVIDEAHALNVQAGSALLKVLEEPPEKTIFILISSNPSTLLSTIRSRSRHVRFKPLGPGDLRILFPEAPSWAIKAAQGSAEVLHALCDQEFVGARTDAVRIFRSLLEDEQFLLDNSWRTDVKDRSFFGPMLRIWVSLIRDALFTQAKRADAVFNSDLKPTIDVLSALPAESLTRMLQNLLKVESEQNVNRDPQLVLEEAWHLHHRGGLT